MPRRHCAQDTGWKLRERREQTGKKRVIFKSEEQGMDVERPENTCLKGESELYKR